MVANTYFGKKNIMLRFTSICFVSFVIFIFGATKINARNVDHGGIQSTTSFPKSANNSQSKAEEKCKQYITEACKTSVSTSISTTNSSEISNTNIFIVGGEKTDPKQHPHAALVGTRRGNYGKVDWFCGGSLISKNFVLTAAHCAEPDPPNVIRLGELDSESTDDDANSTDYTITRVIVHENFEEDSEGNVKNDIALLEFKGVSSFNDYIRPICLNTVHTIPDQKFIAVGWGRTKERGDPSSELRSVELSPQDDEKCKSLYKIFNASTMLCAGHAPGGKDTCQGDSGGPLQIKNEKSECPKKVPIYTQIGITSFGEGCARKNIAGVYTRVSQFIPWIESHVWK